MSIIAAIVLAGLLGACPACAEPKSQKAEPTHLERVQERAQGEEGPAFRTWFEQQSEHPSALPAAARDLARAHHFVFVAGFLNEGAQPAYFNQNRNALLDAGVKPEAIDILFPKSGNSVEENVTFLLKKLPELAAKGPQKLVLIAHSKGAVETLAFVLAAPVFVRDHVQAVFLVQGAFGGSAIADYIKGTGHPLDERMPALQRVEFALAAKGGKLLDARIERGFQSLTRREATALWARLLPPSSGSASRLAKGLADRIFFVRTRRAPEKVCPLLVITARYLDTYYGPNDGLVILSDQWVTGTGRVIADLDVDHSGLTMAGPISDRPEPARRAFTYALLMQMSGAFDR